MQFNQYSVRRFQLTKPLDRSHFQLYLLCHESSQHQGIGHLENENKDTSLTMNKGGTLCPQVKRHLKLHQFVPRLLPRKIEKSLGLRLHLAIPGCKSRSSAALILKLFAAILT